MRFPSITTLVDRAREVILRFPWTMASGTAAAVFAIVATTKTEHGDWWLRASGVAALGLPLTVALTLFAEERGWTAGKESILNLAGLGLLVLFYLAWPGPDPKHEAIRYFQLSAGLHLLVATLPFLGLPESNGFWQYNRRLFLGFLRALVFSMVLFNGLAVALVALDKLFGVDVPSELYFRLYLVTVFVINTAIFLAAVPSRLTGLASDTTYPRVLKVFAQYILTPLVFIYLIILLAYLIKIVFGGEWPSGWIGWLVTSVAVAGLLGFLLVHPLRHDPDEAWIRTYTRWLFIGLIPAAVVLLVAFWKRVLPYGLTELRLLGVLLGLWLLAIAVNYTVNRETGIRRIPVTLAGLLLLTLYGPLSVTSLSVASQGRRLAHLVAVAPGNQPRSGDRNAREASSALRFLLEHSARRQIAAAIPGTLPVIGWDSAAVNREKLDSAANQILAVANMRYLPRYSEGSELYFNLWAQPEALTRIAGYDWMVRISQDNRSSVVVGKDTVGKTPIVIGPDTLRVSFDSQAGVLQLTAARDSFAFDLGALAKAAADSPARNSVPAERLQLRLSGRSRKAMLALESISGKRSAADSLTIDRWQGKLFVGRISRPDLPM